MTHLQGIVFQEDTIPPPGVTALREAHDQRSYIVPEEVCRFGPPGRCGESLGGRPEPGCRTGGLNAIRRGPCSQATGPSGNPSTRTIGWLALAEEGLRSNVVWRRRGLGHRGFLTGRSQVASALPKHRSKSFWYSPRTKRAARATRRSGTSEKSIILYFRMLAPKTRRERYACFPPSMI